MESPETDAFMVCISLHPVQLFIIKIIMKVDVGAGVWVCVWGGSIMPTLCT